MKHVALLLALCLTAGVAAEDAIISQEETAELAEKINEALKQLAQELANAEESRPTQDADENTTQEESTEATNNNAA